jgi:hypothetical protein
MDPSILSNVFSGRRPLPTRYSKDFLESIGLNSDNTFNLSHAFIFVEKQGHERELSNLLNKIYPDKAGVVLLYSPITKDNISGEDTSFRIAGRAFFDGRITTVVHGGDGLATKGWETKTEYALKDYNTAHVLLSIDRLPNKLDILMAFKDSKYSTAVTWQDVQIESLKRNLTPGDLLEWVTSKRVIVPIR